MEFPWRVSLAMALLVGAKLANVAVPIALKHIIDSLDSRQALLIVPLGLLFAYSTLGFIHLLRRAARCHFCSRRRARHAPSDLASI